MAWESIWLDNEGDATISKVIHGITKQDAPDALWMDEVLAKKYADSLENGPWAVIDVFIKTEFKGGE